MQGKKFYVVWQGVQPGIYTSWNECKAQVTGFENARYKSFDTREEAEAAFESNPWRYIGKKQKAKGIQGTTASNRIVRESIAVDAACSGNPGQMEYRGVFTADGTEIFRVGPLQEGTNNIGEFLAIVHALALLKRKNSRTPVYSDSMNAIKWVKRKKCNTKLERSDKNRPIFDLIERAERWLSENKYENPIMKWETENWGEIPADFGRK